MKRLDYSERPPTAPPQPRDGSLRWVGLLILLASAALSCWALWALVGWLWGQL